MINHLTGHDFYHVDHDGRILRFYLLEIEGTLELIGVEAWSGYSGIGFGPVAVNDTVEAIREAVHYGDHWLKRYNQDAIPAGKLFGTGESIGGHTVTGGPIQTLKPECLPHHNFRKI